MFFETEEGGLHGGRIAGLIYPLGLAPECIHFPDSYCFCGITMLAGWWLCFGSKRIPQTLSELLRLPRLIGAILILLGIAGRYYFSGAHIKSG